MILHLCDDISLIRYTLIKNVVILKFMFPNFF